MRVIDASETGILMLGYQGESQRVMVRLPLVDEKTGRNVAEEFPGGQLSLSVTFPNRPGEFIVSPSDYQVAGDWLEWVVKAAYTQFFGEGKLQINYSGFDSTGMTKSRVWRITNKKSISTGAGTVPDWSDWKTELLSAAAAVQEAVESYDEMSAEAEELPAGSTPTAEIDRSGENPVLRLGIPAGQGGGVTVDSELSNTSTNPVQNKVITGALSSQSETIVNKIDKPASGAAAGKVLGLDSELHPVWVTPSGGGSDLPITTPEAYGAKGDGVTDDTAAIQAAVTAGKYVLFDGDKTYKITETIELHSDMVLDFNGCGIISTANISFSASSAFDVTVYTGAYTANTVHSYSTGTGLISLQSEEQVHMGRDYYLGGMTCHSNNGHMNNSLPYDLEACVIKRQSEPMRNIVIRNLGSYSNSIYGNWSYSFELDGAEDVLIEHCNLMPNEQNYVGIGVRNSSNVTIRDCVIVMDDTNNDNTYGVEVIASSFVTVDSCRIHSEKWHCITTGAGVTSLNTTVLNSVLSIAGGVITSAAYSDHGNAMRTFISGCKITGGLTIADGSVTDCEFVKRKDSLDYINICYRPWIGDYVPYFEFNNLRCASKIMFLDSPDVQGIEEDTTARIGRVHIASVIGAGNVITASDSKNEHIIDFDFAEICLENFSGLIARIQVFKKLIATNCTFTNFECNASGYDSLIDYNPEINLNGCTCAYIINNLSAIVLKAENTTFPTTVMGYDTVLPYMVLLNNCTILGTSESGNTVKAQKLWQMANCVFNCRSTPVEKNTGIVKGTNLTTITTGYAGAFGSEIFKDDGASTYYKKIYPTDANWETNTIS